MNVSLRPCGSITETTKSSGELDLDPVLDFMRLLWNVEHGLQSTSKHMETTLGITGPSGWSFES